MMRQSEMPNVAPYLAQQFVWAVARLNAVLTPLRWEEELSRAFAAQIPSTLSIWFQLIQRLNTKMMSGIAATWEKSCKSLDRHTFRTWTQTRSAHQGHWLTDHWSLQRHTECLVYSQRDIFPTFSLRAAPHRQFATWHHPFKKKKKKVMLGYILLLPHVSQKPISVEPMLWATDFESWSLTFASAGQKWWMFGWEVRRGVI